MVPWIVHVFQFIDERQLLEAWNTPIGIRTGGLPTPNLPVLHCPTKGALRPSIPENSYVANAGLGIRPEIDPRPLSHLHSTHDPRHTEVRLLQQAISAGSS